MSRAFKRIVLRFISQNRPDWGEMMRWLQEQTGWNEGGCAQYIHQLRDSGAVMWVTDFRDDLEVQHLTLSQSEEGLIQRVYRAKKREKRRWIRFKQD
jgi:hypothetical protein